MAIMTKRIAGLVIFIFALSLMGCSSLNAQPEPLPQAEYRRISAAEANRMMQELTGFILLDVRTEAEFLQRHIEGAILLPHTEIRARAHVLLSDKTQVILVYCQGGVRSAAAARELVSFGYINVFDFGGINDWPF